VPAPPALSCPVVQIAQAMIGVDPKPCGVDCSEPLAVISEEMKTLKVESSPLAPEKPL